MERAIQLLVGLPGLLFGLQTLGWLTDPAAAAEGLGMPLLDGVGRSTQVGDLTAFFFALTVLILAGAVRRNAVMLGAAALLLGGAAVFRTLAALAHGADLALNFIIIELVITAVLCVGVWRYRKTPESA